MQITMFPTSIKSMFLTSNTKENQERVMRYVFSQTMEELNKLGLLEPLQNLGEEEFDNAITEMIRISVNLLIEKLHNEGYSTCFD